LPSSIKSNFLFARAQFLFQLGVCRLAVEIQYYRGKRTYFPCKHIEEQSPSFDNAIRLYEEHWTGEEM